MWLARHANPLKIMTMLKKSDLSPLSHYANRFEICLNKSILKWLVSDANLLNVMIQWEGCDLLLVRGILEDGLVTV